MTITCNDLEFKTICRLFSKITDDAHSVEMCDLRSVNRLSSTYNLIQFHVFVLFVTSVSVSKKAPDSCTATSVSVVRVQC